ncbi:hypothetical protein LTR53_003728 [Teratosphaeriaceae sp. CCFEE 6253]|nr:hypothetical protein LTR53_003728 [Teratosphaeriaceae sp. CCFEE 6253]
MVGSWSDDEAADILLAEALTRFNQDRTLPITVRQHDRAVRDQIIHYGAYPPLHTLASSGQYSYATRHAPPTLREGTQDYAPLLCSRSQYTYPQAAAAVFPMQASVGQPATAHLPLNRSSTQTPTAAPLQAPRTVPSRAPSSTDLATAWQLNDKKKIVHTCEPDHGQLLTKFKSGTFDYTQRTATNVPTKKVDVPRPGGRVERMWRCAKPSCEYCTWTTQRTDLSEKIAKGHLLFGVPNKKRITGADGNPTYAQQGPVVSSRGGVQPVYPLPANYGTASPFTAAPRQVFGSAQAPASGYQASPAPTSYLPPQGQSGYSYAPPVAPAWQTSKPYDASIQPRAPVAASYTFARMSDDESDRQLSRLARGQLDPRGTIEYQLSTEQQQPAAISRSLIPTQARRPAQIANAREQTVQEPAEPGRLIEWPSGVSAADDRFHVTPDPSDSRRAPPMESIA